MVGSLEDDGNLSLTFSSTLTLPFSQSPDTPELNEIWPGQIGMTWKLVHIENFGTPIQTY